MKNAHGRCLRYRVRPGEEACGDCCLFAQFYYEHSQVQHLHV
ncbi:(2Fe-2S)-binding protein [Sphingomonas sp. 10B4]